MPNTPGFDPNAAATGAGTSASSNSQDIWGLGDYGKVLVTVGAATKRSTGFSGYSRLPAADREGNQRTLAPGTSGPVPLGVPGAARPTQADSAAVQKSVQDLMVYFAGLAYTPSGQAEFAKYQTMLYQAGYYGAAKPSEVAWGSWAGSEEAFRKALIGVAQANTSGAPISFDEFLSGAVKGREAGAKLGPKDPGQVATTTDPHQIAGVLQQTAQTVFGKNLTKDEVAHFISEFVANQKTAAHRQVDANTTAQGAGPESVTFTQGAPDLSTAAQDYIEQHHATEIAGNSAADYLGVIHNLLGG